MDAPDSTPPMPDGLASALVEVGDADGSADANGNGSDNGNGSIIEAAAAPPSVTARDPADEDAHATDAVVSATDAPPNTDDTQSAAHADHCWNRIGVWGDSTCPKLAEYVHCRNCPVYAAGAAQLLDRPAPPGYLDEWSVHIAAEKAHAEQTTESVLTFRAGANDWLALPTRAMVQVVEQAPIHSIPRRRGAGLLGLVSVRSELLLCISLARLLELEEAPAAGSERSASATGSAGGAGKLGSRMLVVQSRSGGRLAFPVAEVAAVERFSAAELLAPPATVAHSSVRFSIGLLSRRGRSIACLDDVRLFAAIEGGIS